MTDGEMLGRIDERTIAIQRDVVEIKAGLTDLYEKHNTMRSEMDTIKAEHRDRIQSQVECAPVAAVIQSNRRQVAIGGATGGGIVAAAVAIAEILRAVFS